jgi:hypothetical protein
MAILPKEICLFNAVPIKIPMTFIKDIEKSALKFIWKHKRPQITMAILSIRSNAAVITISNFRLYYRAIAIKIAWYWHNNQYEAQWNTIEHLDMNPCSSTHLSFNKVPKTYSGEKTASSTNVAGKSGYMPAEH